MRWYLNIEDVASYHILSPFIFHFSFNHSALCNRNNSYSRQTTSGTDPLPMVHLVPSFRMCEAISSRPHMFSWRLEGQLYLFFNSRQVQNVSGATAKINLESFNVTHDVQMLVIPQYYDAGGVDVLENFQ